MPHVIRCYAEGRPGRWEAVCLDFDLAVQGESFQEVYGELNTAIEKYLEYVASLPEAERHRFLNRRVPLPIRLKFIWKVLRTSFRGGRDGGDKERHGYVLPAAA